MLALYNFLIIIFLILDSKVLNNIVHSINHQLGMSMDGFLMYFLGAIICLLIDGIFRG